MDNLWHIDKNPTPQISLEDGELPIGDDDNELNNKIKNKNATTKIKDNKDNIKINDVIVKDNLKDNNDNIVKQINKVNSNPIKDNDNQKTNKKHIRKSKFNNKKNERSPGNQYKKSFNEFDKTQFDKLSNDQLKEKLRTQFERVKAFHRPNQMNNQMNNNQMNGNQMNNQYFNPLQNNHQQQQHQFRNMQFNPANQFNQMPIDFINPINQHMNHQINNNQMNPMNSHMNHQMRIPNQLQHNQFNPQLHNPAQFHENRPFDSIDRKKFNQIDRNFKKLNKKLVDDDSKKVDQTEMIEMLKEMHDLLSKYKGKNGKNFNNKKRELIDKKNDRPIKQFKSKHKQKQQINLHINLQDSNSIEIQSQSTSFDPIITTDSFNNTNYKDPFINGSKFNLNTNGKSNKKKKFDSKNKKPKKINEVCKYYVQDFCVNGNDCNYLHKEFPCKFYHLFDKCTQDEYNCKFSHQPLTEEMKILLNNFVQRNNKELKDFKHDKVLLGDATTTMKNSLNTWEWQQEICKLHNRKKCDDQNKELFRISDEFLMQNKPATADLITKKAFYSQNNDQQNDNLDEELDPDELVALEEIRLIEEANERKEKAEKARKSKNDNEIRKELFKPPVQLKSSSNNRELYQRREDLLNKENNLFNNKYDNKLEELIKLKNNDESTIFDKNSNLYKLDSKLDCKTNLLSSSDFLNRLADETKIDNETKESDKLDDQFNKLFNKHNKEQIKIENNINEQQDDNEINLDDNKTKEEKEEEIRMTNNLINEIIRKSNSIISPQSPSSSRQNSISDKADSSLSLDDDYVQISNELDEFCAQKNLFENLSNDYYNSNLNENDTIKLNKYLKANDDDKCIISRSTEDDFEFKLYICEFNKSKSLEKYEQFYLYNEKAKFDPRLYKYFSTSNAFKDIKINDQSLNSILNQITDDKPNSSSNFFSLSNLSNLRKMKNDESKNDDKLN